MLDVTIIWAGFWTAALWYFQPCARSSDFLGRLFFTITTLFDAKPDKLVVDGSPQPLASGYKNLPDAGSVNINPVAYNHQWSSPIFLCWPGGLLGDFHGWLHSTNSGQVPAQRLRSTRVQTSTSRVRAAASLHLTPGRLRPRKQETPLTLKQSLCSFKVRDFRRVGRKVIPGKPPNQWQFGSVDGIQLDLRTRQPVGSLYTVRRCTFRGGCVCWRCIPQQLVVFLSTWTICLICLILQC